MNLLERQTTKNQIGGLSFFAADFFGNFFMNF